MSVILQLCLCIGLLTLSLSKVTGDGGMVGGSALISEEDLFNVEKIGFDFKELINNAFVTDVKGSNQLPMSYYGYICGTKQLVAGMLYKVQFLACTRNTEKKCITEIAPEKCTVEYLSQPWLLRGAPSLTSGKKICNPVTHEDLGTITECTLFHNQDLSGKNEHKRPKRALTMDKSIEYDPLTKAKFDSFIQKYNKPYRDSHSEEYRKRYEIFTKNLKVIRDLTAFEMGTATYGITEFMDYSEEEYKRYLAPGLIEKKVSIREETVDEDTAIPDSVDWRKKGAVTEVKNQGQCGSCWAFSTTGNIEGQWFIAKKKLISLSEQELVDCDTLDQGCDGGLPSNAYTQIEKLGGLETEKEYPYEGSDDKCQFKKSDVRVYINDSVALPKDEGKLAQWLAAHGPISIGINANVMQFYFGGISHPWKIFCNPASLDHGVLIVGYGTENGTPFWIIKNSWGATWGEKGYYRIYRGGGCCGLNQEATSALVK